MNRIFKAISKPLFAIVPLALLALTPFLVSCGKTGSSAKPDNVDYYTCTMHPSVRSQDPKGKCPICSMDLVPVMKKGTGASAPMGEHAGHAGHGAQMPGMPIEPSGTNAPDQPTEFTVPVQRQQQIGVTYGEITKRPFTHTVRAVGTVAYDKQRHWDYVTRVEGYVEKLFVFSRGEAVEKNAPVLTIYSPDLLTTQKEFMDVLRTQDEARGKGNEAVRESTERLVESAKQRLRLWNVGDMQINELEKTRKPQELLTLFSPFKGIVQNLGVDQGRRVALGDHLIDIVDLSVVWVWAEFYQDELPMLKKGLPMVVTTSSYPGEEFKGKISVIDPFMNDASRTGRVRIDVENPDMKLRPDMYVNVNLTMDMGEGPAVPVSAVLPTGERNIVFVDKSGGKLEPRFVDLGGKYGDVYEIKSGLKEGERVVTSANFLIDAEAKVQGALKSW